MRDMVPVPLQLELALTRRACRRPTRRHRIGAQWQVLSNALFDRGLHLRPALVSRKAGLDLRKHAQAIERPPFKLLDSDVLHRRLCIHIQPKRVLGPMQRMLRDLRTLATRRGAEHVGA